MSASSVGTHHLDALRGMIKSGMEGQAPVIPLMHPRLDRHVRIMQSLYFLFGGQPGTGKSSFFHETFILSPYNWYLKNAIETQETDIKLKIILFNMERPTPILMGKWACLRLWLKYGIIMDVIDLLGRGVNKNKVTDEIYEKVKESLDYFERMLDIVEIVSGTINPTGIWKKIEAHALDTGEIEEVNHSRLYTPNDPNLITIIGVDHLGRLAPERGYDDRMNLKKMSEYLALARDMFRHTSVAVNQFNRNIQDTNRRQIVEPEERDFKGAGNMFEDCDVAMAVFNPKKYKISNHAGYAVNKLTSREGVNRFRSVHVLKNSYGMDDFQVGSRFIGEVGHFEELPPPSNLTDSLYQKYANLE